MPTITTSITVSTDRYAILTPPQGTRAVGKATSITCPLGPAPTRAWLCLTRADLTTIEGQSDVSITWTMIKSPQGEEEPTTTTLTFPALHLVNAVRVGFGGVGNAEAV